MKHVKLKSLESGLIMGYIIEMIQIGQHKEYVIQNGTGRFFVRQSDKVTVVSL